MTGRARRAVTSTVPPDVAVGRISKGRERRTRPRNRKCVLVQDDRVHFARRLPSFSSRTSGQLGRRPRPSTSNAVIELRPRLDSAEDRPSRKAASCPSRRPRSRADPQFLQDGGRPVGLLPGFRGLPSPGPPCSAGCSSEAAEGRRRPGLRYARWSSAPPSSRRLSRPCPMARGVIALFFPAWESSCLLAICSGRRR